MAAPPQAGQVERRTFGPTGVQVPTIGQGTWRIANHRRAREALRAGLGLGMTHIDTAELYKGSEETVRKAVEGTPRDDLFVVSKVLPQHASFQGTKAACAASLERLGMERLDAYLLHWRGDKYPLEETMRALAELADEGRTRFVGVSNFDAADVEEAQRLLGTRHRIACNQVKYHLLDRRIEEELVGHARRQGYAIVAYSPFGGDYAPFPRPGTPGRKVLEDVGRKHGKTPHQVTLRFLTREPHVFTIPKAERADHARENAGGSGWSLDDDDLAALERAFPGPVPATQRRLPTG